MCVYACYELFNIYAFAYTCFFVSSVEKTWEVKKTLYAAQWLIAFLPDSCSLLFPFITSTVQFYIYTVPACLPPVNQWEASGYLELVGVHSKHTVYVVLKQYFPFGKVDGYFKYVKENFSKQTNKFHIRLKMCCVIYSCLFQEE